ncbi:MAG: transporter substrate-binding domain-containing protein [Spirochaetes bacterium]|nr:transporter substrate-binding domain-containing protein [Spirochaetota bacterium]
MKKAILYFIIFSLLPVHIYSGKKITVGINKNYPPHEFIENGISKGFNVDIINAVSRKAGLSVRWYPLEEEDADSLLQSGKIDVFMMSSSKARSDHFEFTKESILDLSLSVFVKSDIYSIQNIQDLAHHTIAVEKGDISGEYLKKKIENVIMIPVSDQKEAMRLVSSGEVFAFVGNKYTGLYLIQKMKLKDIKIIGKDILIHDRVLALTKGKTGLRDLLDKGIKAIKDDGIYNAIYKEWFGYSLLNLRSSQIFNQFTAVISIILLIAIISVLLWNMILRRTIRADRKEIEIKQKQYNTLVNNTNNGILNIDQDDLIVLVNDSFLKIFDLQEKDLLGNNIGTITGLESIKHDILQKVDAMRLKEINTWNNFSLEYNNKKITFNLNGFKFLNEHNNKIITLIFSDISHQEQLYQSQKMEAIGRLVEGVSHDFNNTLTGIISSIESIRSSGYLDNDIKSEIDLIEKFSDRAKELTNKLLIFSEKKRHHLEIIDLNDLLLNIQAMLKRIIKENIEINLYLSDNLKYIEIDPSHLEFILINLVINAMEAMPKGGEILVETKNVAGNPDDNRSYFKSKDDEYVLLQISDNGKGMDNNTLNHVFEPFFSTKEDLSRGLGLYMVYGIVNQNNGFVDVESKEGKGTTFKLYFPAKKEKEGRPRVKFHKENLKKVKVKGKNICIIEDDKELRELLHLYLSKLGATVEDYGCGKDILDKFKKSKKSKKLDLVLMDVVLPDINGKELFQKIKKIFPLLKVIFMSGYSGEITKSTGLDESNFNFLQKPFSLSDLQKVLSDVL